MEQGALARSVALMNFTRRVGTITIYSEKQKHNATAYLKNETATLVLDKLHHETHAKACKKSIYKVAYRRTDACDKSIPAAFVQRALDAKHPDRAHRSRGHNANKHALEYKV